MAPDFLLLAKITATMENVGKAGGAVVQLISLIFAIISIFL